MVLQAPVILRLCASYTELPRDQCVIPERCEERQCHVCGTAVHCDPQASEIIPRPLRVFIVICCQDEDCWGRYVKASSN